MLWRGVRIYEIDAALYQKAYGMFLTAVALLSIETFADLLQPTFMSYIVDKGVKGQEMGLILRYGLIMLGITTMGAVGPWCGISMPAGLPS